MSYKVTLLAGTDSSPYAGLPLQLVRGTDVVAMAYTGDDGIAVFDYTAAAGEALLVRAHATELPTGVVR